MKKTLLFILCFGFFLSTSNFVEAQDFVGSDACKNCHSSKYDLWIDSGHPYKFNVIVDDTPPVYPNYVENFQDTWVDNLGDGTHDWTVIAGVIGGWGWKARFVGDDGHIIGTAGSAYSTGMGHNQINFFGGENYGWADYHPNDEKIYNYGCFKCHTTGGQTTGTWLEGVPDLGTFTEGGIGCESCHGPGSAHIEAPSDDNIDLVYEFAHADNAIGGLQIGDEVILPNPDGNDVNFLCGTCHNRSYTSPINSSGGFIKHHEQWDEFVATKHFENDMDCSTCHDPHKRVIWDGDGITMQCATCHPDQAAVINHPGTSSCLACHMPYAAKSGTKRGESGFVGDVRSHLMKIIADTNSMFTEDGSNVRDDDERPAALSPAFACMGCHNNDPDDGIPEKTIEQAAAGAAGMHSPEFIAEQTEIELGIYPNPTTDYVNITFKLNRRETISVEIFNTSGQLVYVINDNASAGTQQLTWYGTSNTGNAIESGYYFIKVTAGKLTQVDKLLMVK